VTKLRYRHDGAGRFRASERLGVHPIESRPVLDADDVGRHAQHLFRTATRFGENGQHVVERLANLRLERLVGGVTAVAARSQLTRGEDEAAPAVACE
jgi:hypothetical protein